MYLIGLNMCNKQQFGVRIGLIEEEKNLQVVCGVMSKHATKKSIQELILSQERSNSARFQLAQVPATTKLFLVKTNNTIYIYLLLLLLLLLPLLLVVQHNAKQYMMVQQHNKEKQNQSN